MGIGGGQAGRPPDEVSEPRQRGEPHERGEVTVAEQSGDQWGRDIHDHPRDACPVEGEHRDEAPHAQRTEQVQADDRPRHECRHAEQGHDAGRRHDDPTRRERSRRAETAAVEALSVLVEQVAGALGERQELTHRWDTALDEVTTPDDDGDDDQEPGERWTERGFAPASHGGLGADERRRLLAAQVRREPGAPALLEAEDLTLVDEPLGPDRPSAGDERWGPHDQAEEGPERRQGLPEPAAEQPDEELDDRQQDELDRASEQTRAAREGRHRAHPVAGTQGAVRHVGAAFRETLSVADRGVGSDDDPGPGVVGTPAQIDVLPVERDRRVEAAERPEQVGAHQQTGRREDEHVTHGVVLLLVELARLDDAVDLAETVEAEPDVLEQPRLVPVDELRPDDAGVRPEHLGDEQPDGIGGQRNIVVADQEEPVVALDEPEYLVDGVAEARCTGGRPDEGIGQDRTDARQGLLGACLVSLGDQEQGAEVAVVLTGERCKRLLEPVARCMDDHDGHDRGNELGVRLHDGSRLLVTASNFAAPPPPGADHDGRYRD